MNGPKMERYVNPSRYEVDDRGCWIWQRAMKPNGYGRSMIKGVTGYAHRVSYEEHVGPIPEGLTVDHLCGVRACVNPDHLEPVTRAENIRRGGNARKTHCNRGHEYTPENTRYDKNGWRRCIVCVYENNRNPKYRHQRKEKQS